MARKLSALDAVFLQVESQTMLGHVAGLQIFSLPAGAPPTFVSDLVAALRAPRELAHPWNLKLQRSWLSRVRPAVIADHDVDLDYHVRHVALPQPGGERELGMLVSRLHSQPLSRRRPLWECYVIEGLEHGRFALYTKIHHAIADGVTAMRLMTQGLSADATGGALAPWTYARRGARSSTPSLSMTDRVRAAREFASAVTRLGRAALDDERTLALPFTAPRSILNGPIGPQRRFATQQLELARVKAVGQAANATVNDIVLALASTALRRFLKDANALPATALTAGVPISVRPEGDVSGGNAVTIAMASLATDVADPRVRLETIRNSMAQAKQQVQSLSPLAMTPYTALVLTPFLAQLMSGLSGRSRPCFNVAVSNVRGPERALHFGGARLEAMYPVSNPFDGQALNITCASYAGTLNFGFTGCRDSLPGMQHIAVYAGEALAELEAAFGIGVLARAA